MSGKTQVVCKFGQNRGETEYILYTKVIVVLKITSSDVLGQKKKFQKLYLSWTGFTDMKPSFKVKNGKGNISCWAGKMQDVEFE